MYLDVLKSIYRPVKNIPCFFNKLIEINRVKKLPIVMVEQNAYAALEISHRALVLATGQIVMEGKSEELLERDDIVESYLGTKAD